MTSAVWMVKSATVLPKRLLYKIRNGCLQAGKPSCRGSFPSLVAVAHRVRLCVPAHEELGAR